MLILKLALDGVLLSLILYLKVAPHQGRLFERHLKVFTTADYFFAPILRFFERRTKPVVVGSGISIDISSLVLIALLLIAINLL